MARPTLAITLTIDDECTKIDLADTTADYGAGTVTTASVQGVLVTVRNQTTGVYFTYTFTVGTNVITAATASLNGATAVNILSQLSSTAWPFVDNVNELNLWKTYTNFTQPEFADGVYQAEYTISRTSATAFSYTTSKMTVRDCDLCSCEANKFVEIDYSCDCSTQQIQYVQRITALHQSAIYAAQKGMTEKAVNDLNEAIALCDCECNCG